MLSDLEQWHGHPNSVVFVSLLASYPLLFGAYSHYFSWKKNTFLLFQYLMFFFYLLRLPHVSWYFFLHLIALTTLSARLHQLHSSQGERPGAHHFELHGWCALLQPSGGAKGPVRLGQPGKGFGGNVKQISRWKCGWVKMGYSWEYSSPKLPK